VLPRVTLWLTDLKIIAIYCRFFIFILLNKLGQIKTPSMKRIIILSTILVMTASISRGQFTKLGGGLGYTSGYSFHNVEESYNKSGHLYASLKGIVELSLPFHISPSVTFFLPHGTNTKDGLGQHD
jgi:hypothetical protein